MSEESIRFQEALQVYYGEVMVTAIMEVISPCIAELTRQRDEARANIFTEPDGDCPTCKGTGEADSGGFTPQDTPIMVRCSCTYPAYWKAQTDHFAKQNLEWARSCERWKGRAESVERRLEEQRNGMQWISVEERLPEEFQHVLVYLNPVPEGKDWYPRTNYILSWRKRDMWLGHFVDPLSGSVQSGEIPDGLVTHWKPLLPPSPSPASEAEKGK